MGCDAVVRTALRRAARALATLAVAVVLAAAVAMLGAALLGFERYVITGGSMDGTFDRGSLVFAETVPVEDLRVGDVITYEPPARAGVEGLVTHRIVSIRERRSGAPVFRTKGDANHARDPWRFSLDGPEQARAVLGAPYIGYGFAALGWREARMLLIGIPALLVALGLGARLWRQAGEEARELNEIARVRVRAASEADIAPHAGATSSAVGEPGAGR